MSNLPISQLTSRLTKALNSNYEVVNLEEVLFVISALEYTPITKEQLETTRLAKYINQLRRRTKDEFLARRAKNLLKKWREMVIPTLGLTTSTLPVVSTAVPTRSLPSIASPNSVNEQQQQIYHDPHSLNHIPPPQQQPQKTHHKQQMYSSSASQPATTSPQPQPQTIYDHCIESGSQPAEHQKRHWKNIPPPQQHSNKDSSQFSLSNSEYMFQNTVGGNTTTSSSKNVGFNKFNTTSAKNNNNNNYYYKQLLSNGAANTMEGFNFLTVPTKLSPSNTLSSPSTTSNKKSKKSSTAISGNFHSSSSNNVANNNSNGGSSSTTNIKKTPPISFANLLVDNKLDSLSPRSTSRNNKNSSMLTDEQHLSPSKFTRLSPGGGGNHHHRGSNKLSSGRLTQKQQMKISSRHGGGGSSINEDSIPGTYKSPQQQFSLDHSTSMEFDQNSNQSLSGHVAGLQHPRQLYHQQSQHLMTSHNSNRLLNCPADNLSSTLHNSNVNDGNFVDNTTTGGGGVDNLATKPETTQNLQLLSNDEHTKTARGEHRKSKKHKKEKKRNKDKDKEKNRDKDKSKTREKGRDKEKEKEKEKEKSSSRVQELQFLDGEEEIYGGENNSLTYENLHHQHQSSKSNLLLSNDNLLLNMNDDDDLPDLNIGPNSNNDFPIIMPDNLSLSNSSLNIFPNLTTNLTQKLYNNNNNNNIEFNTDLSFAGKFNKNSSLTAAAGTSMITQPTHKSEKFVNKSTISSEEFSQHEPPSSSYIVDNHHKRDKKKIFQQKRSNIVLIESDNSSTPLTPTNDDGNSNFSGLSTSRPLLSPPPQHNSQNHELIVDVVNHNQDSQCILENLRQSTSILNNPELNFDINDEPQLSDVSPTRMLSPNSPGETNSSPVTPNTIKKFLANINSIGLSAEEVPLTMTVAPIIDEPKIPKKRGRKKGSKGVDAVLAASQTNASTFMNSQYFESSSKLLTIGGNKKVKTTKELLADIQNRKMSTSATPSPTLTQPQIQPQTRLSLSRPPSVISDESESPSMPDTANVFNVAGRSMPDQTNSANNREATNDDDDEEDDDEDEDDDDEDDDDDDDDDSSDSNISPDSSEKIALPNDETSATIQVNSGPSIEDIINDLNKKLPPIDKTLLNWNVEPVIPCTCTSRQIVVPIIQSKPPSPLPIIVQPPDTKKRTIDKETDEKPQLKQRVQVIEKPVEKSGKRVKSIFDIDDDDDDDNNNCNYNNSMITNYSLRFGRESDDLISKHTKSALSEDSSSSESGGDDDKIVNHTKHKSKLSTDADSKKISNVRKVESDDDSSSDGYFDFLFSSKKPRKKDSKLLAASTVPNIKESTRDDVPKHGIKKSKLSYGLSPAIQKTKQLTPKEDSLESLPMPIKSKSHQQNNSNLNKLNRNPNLQMLENKEAANLLPGTIEYELIEDPNCEAKKHYNVKNEQITKFHINALHNCYIPNINGNWETLKPIVTQQQNIPLIEFDKDAEDQDDDVCIINNNDGDYLYNRVVPYYSFLLRDKIPKDVSHVEFSDSYIKFDINSVKTHQNNEIIRKFCIRKKPEVIKICRKCHQRKVKKVKDQTVNSSKILPPFIENTENGNCNSDLANRSDNRDSTIEGSQTTNSNNDKETTTTTATATTTTTTTDENKKSNDDGNENKKSNVDGNENKKSNDDGNENKKSNDDGNENKKSNDDGNENKKSNDDGTENMNEKQNDVIILDDNSMTDEIIHINKINTRRHFLKTAIPFNLENITNKELKQMATTTITDIEKIKEFNFKAKFMTKKPILQPSKFHKITDQVIVIDDDDDDDVVVIVADENNKKKTCDATIVNDNIYDNDMPIDMIDMLVKARNRENTRQQLLRTSNKNNHVLENIGNRAYNKIINDNNNIIINSNNHNTTNELIDIKNENSFLDNYDSDCSTFNINNSFTKNHTSCTSSPPPTNKLVVPLDDVESESSKHYGEPSLLSATTVAKIELRTPSPIDDDDDDNDGDKPITKIKLNITGNDKKLISIITSEPPTNDIDLPFMSLATSSFSSLLSTPHLLPILPEDLEMEDSLNSQEDDSNNDDEYKVGKRRRSDSSDSSDLEDTKNRKYKYQPMQSSKRRRKLNDVVGDYANQDYMEEGDLEESDYYDYNDDDGDDDYIISEKKNKNDDHEHDHVGQQKKNVEKPEDDGSSNNLSAFHAINTRDTSSNLIISGNNNMNENMDKHNSTNQEFIESNHVKSVLKKPDSIEHKNVNSGDGHLTRQPDNYPIKTSSTLCSPSLELNMELENVDKEASSFVEIEPTCSIMEEIDSILKHKYNIDCFNEVDEENIQHNNYECSYVRNVNVAATTTGGSEIMNSTLKLQELDEPTTSYSQIKMSRNRERRRSFDDLFFADELKNTNNKYIFKSHTKYEKDDLLKSKTITNTDLIDIFCRFLYGKTDNNEVVDLCVDDNSHKCGENHDNDGNDVEGVEKSSDKCHNKDRNEDEAGNENVVEVQDEDNGDVDEQNQMTDLNLTQFCSCASDSSSPSTSSDEGDKNAEGVRKKKPLSYSELPTENNYLLESFNSIQYPPIRRKIEPEKQPELALKEKQQIAEELEAEKEVDIGQAIEIGHELEVDNELDIGHELEIEQELEIEHEMEVEQELEIQQELEVEEQQIDTEVDPNTGQLLFDNMSLSLTPGYYEYKELLESSIHRYTFPQPPPSPTPSGEIIKIDDDNDDDIEVSDVIDKSSVPAKEGEEPTQLTVEPQSSENNTTITKIRSRFKEWHEMLRVNSYKDEPLTILPYVVID